MTPADGSNVKVEVAANAATDGLNTGPASAVSATATWDAAAPTVEIGGVPAKINSRTVLTATFTFSEAVTGFAIGDVTVTGGAAGAFTAVSATVYTLAVTPADGSNVKVEVAADAATDGLNTGPASAVSATATWDAAAPTVEIGGVQLAHGAHRDVHVLGGGDGVRDRRRDGHRRRGGRVHRRERNGLHAGGHAGRRVEREGRGRANAATDGLNTGPASAVSATATWDAAAPTVEIGGVPAKINSRTALTAFTFSEA